MFSWWRGLLVAVGVLVGVCGLVVGGAGLPGQPDPVGPRVYWSPFLNEPTVTGTVVSSAPHSKGLKLSMGSLTADVDPCVVEVYQLSVPGRAGTARMYGCPEALRVGDRLPVRVTDNGEKLTAMWAMPAPAGFGWPGFTVAGFGVLMAGLAGWSLVRARGAVWPAPVAAVSRWVPVHAVVAVVAVAVVYATWPEPDFRWSPGGWFAATVAAAAVAVGGVWLVRSRGWLTEVRARCANSVGAQTGVSLLALYALWPMVDRVAFASDSLAQFRDGSLVGFEHGAIGATALWVLQVSTVAVLVRVIRRGGGVVRALGVGGIGLFAVGFSESHTTYGAEGEPVWDVVNAALGALFVAGGVAVAGAVVAVLFRLVMPVVRRARDRRAENRAALAAREAGVGG